MAKTDIKETVNAEKKDQEKIICGIMMPISEGAGYSKEHWTEVRDVINEAISVAGFAPQLVSDASSTGLIHQRIVENIYSNPIAVCDISSKNANVMFELGIRLTFDRPVVIIKDDVTDRIFDTDIIEYIPYRRDLRYSSIIKLKSDLTAKITATHKQYVKTDTSFFLGHFKNVIKPTLKDAELSSTELILREFEDLKNFVKSPLNLNDKRLIYPAKSRKSPSFNSIIYEAISYVFYDEFDGDFEKMKSSSDTKNLLKFAVFVTLENYSEKLSVKTQNVIIQTAFVRIQGANSYKELMEMPAD